MMYFATLLISHQMRVYTCDAIYIPATTQKSENSYADVQKNKYANTEHLKWYSEGMRMFQQ
jgi:hypothetical protein